MGLHAIGRLLAADGLRRRGALGITGPGEVLPLAGAVIALLMVSVWAESMRRRDVSIVDVVWGPAFLAVAWVGAIAGDGDAPRRWLLLALTAIWGVRLALHLGRRKRKEPNEDRRYARMRERRGEAFPLWSLVWIFGLQGLLVIVVSLPLQAGAEAGAPLDAAVIPGLALYLVGLAFETLGDAQLTRFRADPATAGQVMDRGLWRYTRHPNYFGDACVWFGLWLVVLPAGGTWWTVVGPIVMTILLVRISGAALLERDIGDRRPEYAGYVRRTSPFLPLPPRGPGR